jgi:osmotically inducible protein OsmC
MATQRKAHARWEGNLTEGSGQVRVGSSALPQFPVTWKARTEGSDSVTSPEELLAAAEAACFSMALSSDLAKAGYQPQSVESTATAIFEQVDGKWTVSTMNLDVTARVPGINDAEFQKIANGTKSGCPVSRAIANNVDIRLNARLEK